MLVAIERTSMPSLRYKELVAEVLPENIAMLKLFKEFRLPDRLEKIASGGPPDAATALSRGS